MYLFFDLFKIFPLYDHKLMSISCNSFYFSSCGRSGDGSNVYVCVCVCVCGGGGGEGGWGVDNVYVCVVGG